MCQLLAALSLSKRHPLGFTLGVAALPACGPAGLCPLLAQPALWLTPSTTFVLDQGLSAMALSTARAGQFFVTQTVLCTKDRYQNPWPLLAGYQ